MSERVKRKNEWKLEDRKKQGRKVDFISIFYFGKTEERKTLLSSYFVSI